MCCLTSCFMPGLPYFVIEHSTNWVLFRYPEFKNLYQDYENIRSIYSLHRVINYIKSAKLEYQNENSKYFAITRALQVTGECLKDTMDTPNISEEIKTRLIRSFPDNVITTLSLLRNLLCDASLIEERNEFLNSENNSAHIYKFLEEANVKFISSLSLKIVEVSLDIIKEFPAKRDKWAEERFSKIIKSTFVRNNILLNFRKTGCEMLVELKNIVNGVNIGDKDLCNNITSEVDNYTELDRNSLTIKPNDEALLDKSDILCYWQSKMLQIRYDIEIGRSANIAALDFVNILNALVCAKLNIDLKTNLSAIMEKIHSELNCHASITRMYYSLLEVKQTSKTNRALPADKHECFKKSLDLWQNLTQESENSQCMVAKEQVVLDLLARLNKKSILRTDSCFINNYSPSLFGINFRNYLAHGDMLFDLLPLKTDNWVNFNYEFIKGIEGHGQNLERAIAEETPNAKQRCDQHIKWIAYKNNLFKQGNFEDLENDTERKPLLSVANNSIICNNNDININGGNNNINSYAKKGTDVYNKIELIKIVEQGRLQAKQLKFFCKTNDINKSLDEDGNTPLHISCLSGFTKQVKLLLSKGANVDVTNNNGHCPIHIAILWGREAIVKLLMDDYNDYKALVNVAVFGGHLPIFKMVCKNLESDALCTALRVAASMDRIEIVKFLTYNKHIAEYNTLINICALYASNRVLHYLLSDAMVKKNHLNPDELKTCLPAAIRSGNINTLKMLVGKNTKLKLNVNSKNRIGNTALHTAVELSRIDMVKYLKDKGADVNETNNQKRTPLHLAVLNGNVTILETLLKWDKIEIDARDNDGASALHIASQLGLEVMVMKLLEKSRQKGKPILNIVTKDTEYTALHLAVAHGKRRIVELLVQAGADMEMKTTTGFSVLHLSAMQGNMGVFEYLCRQGLDFNSRDINEMTPLHLALNFRNKYIAIGLIQSGAELNQEDCHKWTPLHYAVAHNLIDVVRILLQSGATQTDEICIAAFFGYDEMIECLVNKNTINSSWSKDFPLVSLSLATSKNRISIKKYNKMFKQFDASLKVIPPQMPLSFVISSGNMQVMSSLLGKRSGRQLRNAFKLQLQKAYTALEITSLSTPLHLAVKNRNISTIELLLQSNADVNLKDQKGKTPIALARETRNPEIYGLFQKSNGFL